MQFELNEEQRMVQRTVREFVQKELYPLEQDYLRNDREGRPGITEEQIRKLQLKRKRPGFGGLIRLRSTAAQILTRS